MKLTQQQVDFFRVFGFLKLPGLLKAEIGEITAQFERVLQAYEEIMGTYDGSKRLMVPCVDSSYYLSGLLDHPSIVGAASSLIGDDFNYWGSDGNYYTGDTPWHPDGNEPEYLHIKMAFYLDPLEGSNGALRVIPGSHRETDRYAHDIMQKLRNPEEHFGIHGSEVPAQVLDVVPGDVLIFNHRTFHSAWGGGRKRRMFTMNMCERYKDEDKGLLQKMILPHIGSRISRYFGDAMLESAGAERMKHLEQFINLCDWDLVTKDKPTFQFLKI